MRSATAQIVSQCLENLVFAWLRISIEQSLGRHDHSVEAIAALRSLFIDESLLHEIRMIERAQAFQRDNVPLHTTSNRNDAGACGDAVYQHRACTALSEAASKFWTVELKVVPQDAKQACVA
jgi:hypothetical protein